MKTKAYTIETEPTESPYPYKRTLVDSIDPTEYTREEYDRKLIQKGIKPIQTKPLKDDWY